MVTSRLIHTEVLLVFIFALFQEVLSFIDDCGYYTCVNSYCCFNRCCFKVEIETPEDSKPAWFIPVVIFGAFTCFSCLLVICASCCKMCKASEQPRPQEPTRTNPIPLPAAAPPLPTAPVLQTVYPPPYDEVVWKSDIYSIPMEPPPSYDNIAMEDLPPLDTAQPPGSMPVNHS